MVSNRPARSTKLCLVRILAVVCRPSRTDCRFSGCFEHYITLRQQDANLDRFEKALAWLGTYDIFNSMMRTEREYGVLGYLAYPAVAFFPLFQERGGPKIERPKADWEVMPHRLAFSAVFTNRHAS